MGGQKRSISKLAIVFAEIGVKKVNPISFFYNADEGDVPTDVRKEAGIEFLDRTRPAAHVTLYFPELNEQGFAVDQFGISVAFSVKSKAAFVDATNRIEEAFLTDANALHATGVNMTSRFFPAEPPPRGVPLMETLGAASHADTTHVPIARHRRNKVVTFDATASGAPERETSRVPVDVALKRTAGRRGGSQLN